MTFSFLLPTEVKEKPPFLPRLCPSPHHCLCVLLAPLFQVPIVVPTGEEGDVSSRPVSLNPDELLSHLLDFPWLNKAAPRAKKATWAACYPFKHSGSLADGTCLVVDGELTSMLHKYSIYSSVTDKFR